MSRLIPVIYRKLDYPSHIRPNICEIPGNFDSNESFSVKSPYSLHTEYSYGSRTFKSEIFNDLVHIKLAQKNNIPQLWHNKKWAKDFFKFIEWFIQDQYRPPEVLEIHPPFNDYCKSFNDFINIFKYFYDKFKEKYPTTKIVIENRFGTRYTGGKFLLSKCSDILEFCNVLSRNSDINLKIVLDYPQLFSSETKIDKKTSNWMGSNPLQLVKNIITFNQEIEKYKELIAGFHMWGKCKDKNGKWAPHQGNFDTFFSNNDKLKNMFLTSVFSTFNDGIERYFVPEVNSGENDLHSIIADMENAGFIFKSHIVKTKEKLKLEAFQKAFNGFFCAWDIQLPIKELVCREYGIIEKSGWLIQFRFGKIDKKEYMDVYCSHNLTNDRHFRIYENGKSESLPAFPAFLTPYNLDDPEDKKRAEENDKKQIDEIKKILIEKGFYPFPYTKNWVHNINLHIKNNM
jgi:hypothetical protein